MSKPSLTTQAWARQLLAAEADAQGNQAVRVSEKLRVSLTRLVGADGFTALLRRALALARADVPSLQTVKVATDGRLEGLQELAPLEDGVEAGTAIIAHLLELLVTFIGETLTLRIVRGAWPDAWPDALVDS